MAVRLGGGHVAERTWEIRFMARMSRGVPQVEAAQHPRELLADGHDRINP